MPVASRPGGAPPPLATSPNIPRQRISTTKRVRKTRSSASGAPFLASEFYEAVKAELDQTPRHKAGRVGALAAAADQCRRSAENCTSPQLMLVEIRAAVSVLCNGRYQKLAAE